MMNITGWYFLGCCCVQTSAETGIFYLVCQQQQQQQQHLFTKHSENTMMEGQQGYEKHLWPPKTKKESSGVARNLWQGVRNENLYSPEMVETAENKNLTNFN